MSSNTNFLYYVFVVCQSLYVKTYILASQKNEIFLSIFLDALKVTKIITIMNFLYMKDKVFVSLYRFVHNCNFMCIDFVQYKILKTM